jgi:hypothetical protein
MINLQTGQCGICVHFGERHQERSELQHIRSTSRASELYTDECGHPMLAQVRLRVTPISGCDAFQAAKRTAEDLVQPEAPH